MIEHSVLIHSRNHAAFIDGCVESVLGQSLPPEEIVVYDEGSTDDTIVRLRRFGDRIRVIAGLPEPQPVHIAEAHAVQNAFAASHGEIIFLLDGDDRFKPEKIARYAAAFRNHPDASVVQAPLERIDAYNRPVGVTLEPRYHVSNHLREIYRRNDLNFFYPTSALAFSRSYLERILPMNLDDGFPLWTDARLCIPAAYYGRIVTLPDPLTDWRVHTVADTRRARPGTLQVRQTLMRARVFNAFCRRHHLRTISPWRSRRLYLQLARCAAPRRLIDFYQRRVRTAFDDVT